MALVLAIGAGVASLIGWCDWERWAYSWPLGVSLLGWWMFVLSLLGIRWSWWSIGLPLAIGAGLLAKYTCSHWSTATFRLRSIYLRPSWELGGILILCFLITCLILQTTLLPFTDRDTWRVWGLKGQGFYLDGSVTPVLAIADLSRYSPTQPLVQAWGYITMDGISERLVKIIFPLWYIACIGMIWVTCRHWQSAIIALGWTLLLATTPVLLDHATLGNADLPLAAGLLVSALTLCRWIESCSWRWLIGSAVGIAGASWIKLNGAFIGIWMLGVAVMIRSITSRRWEKKSIKSILLISFVSLGICFALIAPLGFYAWNHGFHSDIEQSYLLQGQGLIAVKQSIAVMSEEFILSPFNSAMGLLGGGYGVLWIVCGSILLSNWRRLRHDRILCFLLLAVVGGIIFYLAIFTFNTAYFTSAERYLLHIAPLAVLAAARSTCLPELAFPLIRASATHAEGV